METIIKNIRLFVTASIFIGSISTLLGQYNNINKTIALNQYEDAIILMEQRLNKDSQNPDLYFNLGNAYLQTEQYGLALWAYESTINLRPNHAGAFKNSQYIYKTLERGDYEPYIHNFIFQLRAIGSNKFALIALFCSLGITTILLISKKLKSRFAYRIGYTAILFFLLSAVTSSITALYLLREDEYHDVGIIITPNAPTYLSNFDLAPYQLLVGSRFEIMEQLSDKMWKVKMEDEKTVIINNEHIRLIR